MNFIEIVDMVECVACHKCSLTTNESSLCATCEVGYRFVSENPLQLSCSHVICTKCKQDENIECSKDGWTKSGDRSYAVERVIVKKKDELMQNLRDKLNASYEPFEGCLKLKH